jgi:ribosomal protein S18 acetylase RimI-like enzyme
MEIKIVKMEEGDLRELLKLGKKEWPDESWITLEYLKKTFAQEGLAYTAKIEDEIIGGIILLYEDVAKNWIRYLIVKKEFRRSGIGKMLLDKIVEKIKSGESIFVDTGVVDKAAIAFYEENGFKNRGKISSLYDQRAGYIFEKNIK